MNVFTGIVDEFMKVTNAFVDYTDHTFDDFENIKDIVYIPPRALSNVLGRDIDQCIMCYGFLVAISTGVLISLISNVTLRKIVSFTMSIFIGLQVLGVRVFAVGLYQFVAYLAMLVLPRNVQQNVTIWIAIFVTIVVHIYVYRIRDNTFGTASAVMASFVR